MCYFSALIYYGVLQLAVSKFEFEDCRFRISHCLDLHF